MRILVVSNLFPPAFLGGYEIGASWACAELKRRGHDIMLWTASAVVDGRREHFRILDQPRREDYQWLPAGPCIYGIDVLGRILLQKSDPAYAPVKELLLDFLRTYPARCAERRSAIEKFAPETILIFNPVCILDPVFAELARIPALTKIPAVALISDDWPLRLQQSHPLTYVWRHWHELKLRAPAGLSEIDRAFLALGDWMNREGIFHFATPPAYSHAAFTSQHLRNKCRSATLHGTPTEVIHWGLPGVADYPRAEAKEPGGPEPLRLAYCGQLLYHKGLIRILRALRHTRRACSLLVVGDDTTDYGRFCHAYVQESGLNSRVEFTGKIPAAQVAPLFAKRADVLLLPSLNGGPDGFEEPFSIVLLQGMALGLAVAASRSGGSTEAFVDHESGRFMDPDEPAEITRLIDEWDADRDQVRRLGAAARARVEAGYTIEHMTDRLLAVANAPAGFDPPLLYAVRNATIDPANSGCVRVTRRLGRLLESRSPITFATWRSPVEGLHLLRADQAEVLGRFNGPRFGLGATPEQDVMANSSLGVRLPGGWLVLPEIMSAAECRELLAYARRHRMRTAAIFYDSIALLQPEFCNEEIRRNHADYMRALAGCDLVMPISHFSEKCLRDFWTEEDVTSTRVQTALLPGEFSGARLATGEPPPLDGVVRVLCVSTLEPRKNHRRLLAAFQHLREMCPGLRFELDLVGNGYAGAQEITHAVEAACAADDRIKWWRVVDDHKLEELYTQAHFTIYPSLIEGYGLPIVESIWHERPCICSDSGVMAELAADGGCLATNVRDELCLAQAMAMLATDEVFRRRLTLEASRRPLKTWEQYAGEILDHIHNISP
jgi:glycosyltransferase involved in cell wall biosynthesis